MNYVITIIHMLKYSHMSESPPSQDPNVVVKRGRGRPRKNKSPEYVKISTKSSSKPKKKVKDGEIKPKRKYTRRKPVPPNKADDNTIIKPEQKKRGRKRGHKQDTSSLFTAEEVIDYIHRNFPLMRIDRIRDKTIQGLKTMREFNDCPYLLYKFTHDNTIYYYDDKGAILNTDGKLSGLFVLQKDNTNKMYLFKRKNKDTRTFQEVINSIERRKR